MMTTLITLSVGVALFMFCAMLSGWLFLRGFGVPKSIGIGRNRHWLWGIFYLFLLIVSLSCMFYFLWFIWCKVIATTFVTIFVIFMSCLLVTMLMFGAVFFCWLAFRSFGLLRLKNTEFNCPQWLWRILCLFAFVGSVSFLFYFISLGGKILEYW